MIVRTYQPGCDADLGDTRCGVTLVASGFTRTAVVASVVSRNRFTITLDDADARAVDGWYDSGALKFTTGNNANWPGYDIRRWTNSLSRLDLWGAGLRLDAQVGDALTLHPGCDKTFGVNGCTRFANNVRFRGFRYLPGKDFEFAYASD